MPFSEQFVKIPPSSTGLEMRLIENTVGANTVEMEPVVLSDPNNPTQLANVTSSGALQVDASATTQPVSATSLPLPSNAAKETGGNLASIVTNTGNIPALGQALAAGSVPVVLTTSQLTTLTPPTPVTAAAIGTSVSGDLLIGTQLAAASVPVALPAATISTLTPPTPPTASAIGTAVSTDLLIGTQTAAASVPVALPSATITTLTPPAAITNFALETGGNLASIKADTDKIPSLGQALAAASVPVVLTAAQLTTLTPLTSVTATQATGTNLHVVVDTAPSTAVTNAGTFAVQAAESGTWNVNAFPGITLAALSAQGTTSGNTQTIPVAGAEAVLVQLTQTSTLTAGAVTFEFSYDGSNWLACPASSVVDPTSTTFAQIAIPYTVQASTNKVFLILMNGAQGLRIRTSTTITGTGSVTPNYALLSYDPVEQIIALSPTAANFNVTANIAASQTIAVTNTGTFATQATLSAETTKVIGTVNQGTSPWVVSGAVTESTLDAAVVSQEATTSGVKGLTAFGAVTTNAPSYSTTKSDALSLDTSGLLRVSLKDTPANTNKFLVTPDANSAVNVAQVNGVTPLMGNGTTGTGSMRVTIASDNTANSNPFLVTQTPGTSGGLTTFHLASAATTNATVVKNSAGQLYGWMISNTSAAYTYLAFHNASSTPTAGASIFFKIGIPATSAANVSFDSGIPFSTGIAITTVTGAADNNSTAVALNDQIINLFYK